MNSGLWIFPGGVAVGLVIGLIVGQLGGPDAEEKGSDEQADASAVRVDDDRDRDRDGPRRFRRRDPISRLYSGDPRSDLDELMLTLGAVKDETELNLTDLIRRASLLTMLREDEALDVLTMLNEHANSGARGGEFIEIASAIVFSRLCELNGPAAMSLLADERYAKLWENHADELSAMGMNSWVAADPAGAQRWFDDAVSRADALVGESGERTPLTGDLAVLDHEEFRLAYMNAMAKIDPIGLNDTIASIGSEEARSELEGEMLQSLVRNENRAKELESLLDRAVDAPDARRAAMEKLSKLDTDAAADWVGSQPPSDLRDTDVRMVASEMMDENPEAGINWYMAQRLVGEARQAERLSLIVNRLGASDPQRAADWLASQPDTSTRDAAEASMAWFSINRNDWTGSMQWFAGVQDPSIRDTNLSNAFRRGWDQSQGALRPEVLQAAEAAGFGEQARAYQGR